MTYRKDIRPLWETQCMACHVESSPSLAVYDESKGKYKALSRGPRMDSYAHLVAFVGWPDSGAVMRRLDDGKHTRDGETAGAVAVQGTHPGGVGRDESGGIIRGLSGLRRMRETAGGISA